MFNATQTALMHAPIEASGETQSAIDYVRKFISASARNEYGLYQRYRYGTPVTGLLDEIEQSLGDVIWDTFFRVVRRYDPKHPSGASFRTYLYDALKRERYYWRSNFWLQKSAASSILSIDAPFRDSKHGEGLNELIFDPRVSLTELHEGDEWINSMLAKLGPFDQYIVTRHLFYGETFKALGDRYALTRERIRQRYEKALSVLREELERNAAA